MKNAVSTDRGYLVALRTGLVVVDHRYPCPVALHERGGNAEEYFDRLATVIRDATDDYMLGAINVPIEQYIAERLRSEDLIASDICFSIASGERR